MNGPTALVLGLGLGLRHATDADHVVAVTSLLTGADRRPLAQAARIAASWGLGHSATLLGTGVVVVLLGIHPSPRWEAFTEYAVAVLLVAMGLRFLWERLRPREEPTGAEAPRTDLRAVALGLVHGLAGSGAVALLAVTTIDEGAVQSQNTQRLWAFGYLLLFGVGTIVGMVLLTLVLARLRTSSFRPARLLPAGAAFLSVVLGLAVLAERLL